MIIRLLVTAFMLLLIIKPAYAAQSTITEAEGYSCMGDDKSRKQTEQTAMIDAKKNAAEYTSTYIKSETQVKDFTLQKDLVSAYANAEVKILEDLDKGWYQDPTTGACYKIKIKAEVIPDEQAMEKLSQAAANTTDQGNIDYPVAPPPVVSAETSSQQVAAAGPDVVVVPSGDSYVYMVPNTTGVYFYGGSWYRYYEGYWFRSPDYARNWAIVAPSAVPRVVLNVPPEYPHYLPPAYYRIHYNDFHQHWQAWYLNHEWLNRDWFKTERRPDVIAQRNALINQEREQHRVKRERLRQVEKQQQFNKQEQRRVNMGHERQELRQQSLQQKQDRVKMERKRQMAQQKSQRDRKAEGKDKKKQEKKQEKKKEKKKEKPKKSEER